MSKSLGNVIDPLKLIADSGADVLRLWVASVDSTEDVRIGRATLQTATDSYRKLRNTLRYLLGALAGHDAGENVAHAALPDLERYILSRLHALDGEVRAHAEAHAYNQMTAAILSFVNQDLSAFLFDVRKDSLYCDPPGSLRRRAYRTTLAILFDALVRMLAPVLVFTAEEAHEHRHGPERSVHLECWVAVPAAWRDHDLEAKFERLRSLRTLVNQAIEPLRRDKQLGSSLEAHVRLTLAAPMPGLDPAAFAELCIVASVAIEAGAQDAVTVVPSSDPRCARCWQHVPDVAPDTQLCGRCADAVAA
jgi:isoleucyl-tRNA synthetase